MLLFKYGTEIKYKENAIMISLGNNIKYARKKLGLTQEELATQIGVTPQAVSKWEKGTA